GSVTFPATPLPWSHVAGAAKRSGAVTVDTNGDLTPDTLLSGTSNFLAGQSPGLSKAFTTSCSCCAGEIVCHADQGEQHCTTVPQCTDGTPSCC
ncbi:MAG TPA: hypothetical protein VIW92_15470, partial [Thermoanaerobaculia bacterium]